MVFGVNQKLLVFYLFFYALKATLPWTVANAKADQSDKIIDLKDVDFYKDADVNISLAKQKSLFIILPVVISEYSPI